MASSPKTIDDLPHLRVSTVAASENEPGYFVVSGVLDRIEGVDEGQCSFIVPSKDVLTAFAAHLTLHDKNDRTAIVRMPSESEPELLGLQLTYVPPDWDPPHVWMVAEPRWKWERTLFRATDAISTRIRGEKVSIVEGEEITEWIVVKEKGKDSGRSRHYPVFPRGKHRLPQAGPDGLIKDGWNHAHCELCHSHIGAGSYGYVDPGEYWVCEDCYTTYVRNHDLSFMFI